MAGVHKSPLVIHSTTSAAAPRASQTIYLEQGKAGESIVVGYDKRFASEYFAQAAAEVMVGNGFRVFLTDGATPTPVISFAVPQQGAVGGINITASHNPPTDNGFKVRDENGGAIPPDDLKKIEQPHPRRPC